MRKILFVGEKINSRISKIPFDERFNSGKFLHISLQRLPSYIYFNSEFSFDNVYIGRRINKTLELKQFVFDKIIALGNKAYRELKKMKIECSHIPHPSYYKRFKSKSGHFGYALLIMEAIND